jgi:hypothetical protein
MKAWKHPATVISLLALFVALGGEAAMASGLISGKNIKNHTIAAEKLTPSAIKALRGDRGPAGATGPTGLTGAQGPIGPSSAVSAYNQSTVVYGSTGIGPALVSLTLPAGSYVILGKTTIADTTDNQNSNCWLGSSFTSGIIDVTGASTALVQPAAQVASVDLVAPLNTTGTTISVFCQSNESHAQAKDSHLVAIKVGAVTGT